MSEIPLPSSLHMLMGLYGYFLPLMLYAAWSTLAFWDIGRRDQLTKGASIGWLSAVLLIPFFGALAYHVIGGSQIPRQLKTAVIGGGLGLFVVVLLIGRAIGGIS